ncbi:MAG: hypothetical protein WBF52_04490 [Geitlerinemataceae cyanobacterium]
MISGCGHWRIGWEIGSLHPIAEPFAHRHGHGVCSRATVCPIPLDFILPPAEIAEKLADISRHPILTQSGKTISVRMPTTQNSRV